jgi:hypothetical protein
LGSERSVLFLRRFSLSKSAAFIYASGFTDDMLAALFAVRQSKAIFSVINDCGEPGITRGLTQPVFMKLARLPGGRLSAPLSPAQSLLHEISFKTTDAAARRDFFSTVFFYGLA